MPRDNICMYMAHVCFYVCCSDCGNVCGVAAGIKIGFNLGVLKYVVCLCKVCDGYCVFYLYCDAWSCRCSCMGSMTVSSCRWGSCMGSMSVSSCRCCMFVSYVHPVAVLNNAFCIHCSLLMMVEDARGDHMEEAYSRAGLMTAL